MTIDRIAILGGSSVYIPELILSLICHNVKVKEIVLIGLSPKKLSLVTGLCQRILKKSGFPATVIGTTNIEEGVRGAKYILNHVRVGGMQARLRDEKLPLRYGMVGDECLGAGGFASALRTLPVVLEMADTVARVNPDATFINLSNPMGIVVEALCKYSPLKVIGACDDPYIYTKKLAELLEMNPSELTVDYVGLSQMGWIQDVKADGRSCMSRVLERLDFERDDGFDCDLIDLFRMIPTRTVSLFFHQDEILKKQKACSRFRAEALWEVEQQILKLYESESLAEVPDLTRERNAAWYQETVVPLLEALENDTESETVLCIRNGGAIRDLPDDCSVEVPAKVSRLGWEPRAVGNCPRFLRGIFLSVKESDRLTVEAVRHRSYEYALQALTINPLVPSLEAAKKYLERVVKEEKIELH
ncbi:MAG: hypothetical protein RBU21_02665 [FCB group bacterium]|jgi:6-phospho-beta-glucosidase|nr:hypothetical protein [FCB group bacterium]